MNIALKSLASDLRGDQSQARHLRWLAALDPECAHALTDDEDNADAILLTDAVGGPRLADALLNDRSIKKNWEKVFIHSEEARPFRLLPGLYTSLPSRPGDEELARAIGYPCWTPNAMNLCIDQSATSSPERDPDLLYSFIGRRSHPVRDRILDMTHPGTAHVVDSSELYRHFTGGAEKAGTAQRTYVDIALRSKFALCPRGWATSTLRLYEMMALGVAPVILADRWVAPRGPDWSRCAVFVPERQAADLPRILAERESEWQTLGAAAFAAFLEYFSPQRQFRTVTHALADLAPVSAAARQRLKRLWPVTLPAVSIRPWVRDVAKRRRAARVGVRVPAVPVPAVAPSVGSRGYLTLASGSTHYLEMAVDMALSLRQHTRLPVAVAVDARIGEVVKSRYANVFDEVVPVAPRFQKGRALKYSTAESTPFEETIFVDADCVVLGSLDGALDALGTSDLAMVGELLTPADDEVHHGFSTRALMDRFGLDRYLKTNSGLFAFRRSGALRIMEECLDCYLNEARPALRGSIFLGRWIGDEIAFGIVGGRRRLGTLPPPSPMYWPKEFPSIDLRRPAKPLLHMLWPPSEAVLDGLIAGTVARRREAGLPGGGGEHWRREAESLLWMARRRRLRDRLARPLRRPHIPAVTVPEVADGT